MKRIKLPKDRKGEDLMPYVVSKDNRHEVVALFVGRSEAECKRWLDKHRTTVLKLCIPYEVS